MAHSSQSLLSPQVRLGVAIVMILAGAVSTAVATTTLQRVVNPIVVIAGLLMAVDSIHQLRTRRTGAAVRR